MVNRTFGQYFKELSKNDNCVEQFEEHKDLMLHVLVAYLVTNSEYLTDSTVEELKQAIAAFAMVEYDDPVKAIKKALR